MMSKLLVYILLLFVTLPVNAQTKGSSGVPMLHGVVSAADGKGISRVICRLETVSDSLLSYTLTNNRGEYQLNSDSLAGKVTYSFVGYDTVSRFISPGIYRYDITLYKRTYNLNEVTVTVAPLERRKDTLFYNVGAFIHKEDVYIEDVLKRMPGIDVSPTGEITYQGRSINKLNIEGMDLMGNRYNQATKNMPATAVSQIQIMENNQPIRVLDGKIRNDHATINIRLKKEYKLRPFGEMEGGVGLGEKSIWANTVTAIKTTPKNQYLLTGTMDNRGIELSSITRDMANNDRVYNNEPLPSSLISNIAHANVPISPLYYLDNKSYFLGANYLHAFTKKSTIRFNVLYNHESITRSDTLLNQYIANDTITVTQKLQLHNSSDIVKAQMHYELNESGIYIEDIITNNMEWRKEDAVISPNSEKVRQDTKSSPITVQNSLNGHVKLGGQILSFSSVMRYFKTEEQLNFSQPFLVNAQLNLARLRLLGLTNGLDTTYENDDRTLQHIRLESLFMRHRIMYSFNLWRSTLSLAYMLEGKDNSIKKHSVVTEEDKSRYMLHTFEPTYTLAFNSGEITLCFPIEYIAYRLKQHIHHQYLMAPSIDYNLKLSSSLSGRLFLGYNQDVNTYDVAYSGLLYNNYRTMTMGIDSLERRNTAMADITLSYLNTLSLVSMNIVLRWSKQHSNYMQDMLFTETNTLVRPLWTDNNRISYNASYNINKMFRQMGLQLNYTLRYAMNERKVNQNNITDNILYHTISNTFRIEWNKWSWLSLMLTGGQHFRWKAYDRFSASHNYLRDYEYLIKIDLFPISRLHTYIDYYSINHEITSSHYSAVHFINCGLIWNITKRVKLKCSMTNVLDTKKYEESYYDGANHAYYAMPLRGRELLLALNYKF